MRPHRLQHLLRIRFGRFGNWLLAGGGMLAAVLASISVFTTLRRQEERIAANAPSVPSAADALVELAAPALSESRFLNAKQGVQRVGSDLCRGCHTDRHASFRHTGMGRSMAEVDPLQEPPDGTFDHIPSKRRYRVYRKNDEVRHRELLLTAGSSAQPADEATDQTISGEVELSDYAVKYVIGSGRHSRSYLVEADGFLVESPVTWYASLQAWGVSPGYDIPDQVGFARPVGESCLFCHAGRANAIGGSLHRMNVIEPALSCEQCHGPGELHVARHSRSIEQNDDAGPQIDETIVNPARLSRELSEAVCQQCHLQLAASVTARGREPFAFIPGLPLEDFRLDYQLERPESEMKVVGHVEQMHLSRCYQASETLTCLTCHDPHGEPAPADREMSYKSVCLSCHEPVQCRVNEAVRQEESPQNNCIDCHMPRSDTDIPHLAFTHHRIGIHKRTSAAERKITSEDAGAGDLRPFLDLSGLSEADRKRSLGLAYVEVSQRETAGAAVEIYQKRALQLLFEARSAGINDGALEASLAHLRFALGLGETIPHARNALEDSTLMGELRCNALFILADGLTREGRVSDAIVFLQKLTQMRRHPADWLLLSRCHAALGAPASFDDAETAVRINPRLWQVHQALAEQYRQLGNEAKAAWHERRAAP